MKAIEIFLDESGSMGKGAPVNVTGLVLVSADETASESFHNAFHASVRAENLTAGLCDAEKRSRGKISAPTHHLEKRPPIGMERQHAERLGRFLDYLSKHATEHEFEVVAFSFTFPGSSPRPWSARSQWENELLDRSYLERVKDALELLFFESEWMPTCLKEPCLLAVDLPTRSVSAVQPQGADLLGLSKRLWKTWGLVNDGQGKGKLRVGSLSPADGANLLTSILGRRKDRLSRNSKVERARCVRLMDWTTWEKDCPTPALRNDWFQRYVPPKQIHYAADFLAHAVWKSSELLSNAVVQGWFQKGFLLDGTKGPVDPWIQASRQFSNGDHCGALATLHREKAMDSVTGGLEFFRHQSKVWLRRLTGEDLRSLFRTIRPCSARVSEPARPALAVDLISRPEARREADTTKSQEMVHWRAVLRCRGRHDLKRLAESVSNCENVPNSRLIGIFQPEDTTTEFLLELGSPAELRNLLACSLLIAGIRFDVEDCTVPSRHRLSMVGNDREEPHGPQS
jgi:hypothetical protein